LLDLNPEKENGSRRGVNAVGIGSDGNEAQRGIAARTSFALRWGSSASQSGEAGGEEEAGAAAEECVQLRAASPRIDAERSTESACARFAQAWRAWEMRGSWWT